MNIMIMAAAGIVTWLLRASFIAAGGNATLPPAIERLLSHARPAVLAALIASALLARGGGEPLQVPFGWLLAASVTAIVAWRWRNLALSGAAGLVVAWITS